MSTGPNGEGVTDADERTKPPFLRRVRIRGYKSIAFCDVTLEPLTVLVGRNASGKSNFLDALAFLRDVMTFGVHEAVKRHGGVGAILCRLHEARSVLIEIECGFTLPADEAPWEATYRLGVKLPKNRSASISHEYLKLEQGQWWVGYTNNVGRVTCGAADDQLPERSWKVKGRPLLDACNDTPVPEFAERLEALTAYNFHSEAMPSLVAIEEPETSLHPAASGPTAAPSSGPRCCWRGRPAAGPS